MYVAFELLDHRESLPYGFFPLDLFHVPFEEVPGAPLSSICPSMRASAADRNLMPEFSGLSDAASCRDWDPGIPIDLDRIRKKDELYWDIYKGTPKAFVTLNAAQRMWENRFGSLTVVRYPGTGEQINEISSGLLKKLVPSSLGFEFLPVREYGVNAGMGAVDFGQLFMGLSIFIIISALLLTGLLFIFGVEHRSDETGLLFALGIPLSRVRYIFIIEGAVIAFFGSIPGAAAGIFYNRIILYGLSTIWQGALGTSDLVIHIKAPSILTGVFSGTGGFAFYGETTLPVLYDLNSDTGGKTSG